MIRQPGGVFPVQGKSRELREQGVGREPKTESQKNDQGSGGLRQRMIRGCGIRRAGPRPYGQRLGRMKCWAANDSESGDKKNQEAERLEPKNGRGCLPVVIGQGSRSVRGKERT
jgi:hypothetical protein